MMQVSSCIYHPQLMGKAVIDSRIRWLTKRSFHVSVRRKDKHKWPPINKSSFTSDNQSTERRSESSFGVGQSMKDFTSRLTSSATKSLSSAAESTTKSFTNLSSVFVTKANESARKLAVKTTESGKEMASRATESARKIAAQTSGSGKELASNVTDKAPGVVSSIGTYLGTKGKGLAQWAGKLVLSTIQSSISILGTSIKSAFMSATSSISNRIRARAKVAKEYFEKHSSGVTRQFWWWSLAAIGVYGVATTLPRELVRVAFDKKRNAEES